MKDSRTRLDAPQRSTCCAHEPHSQIFSRSAGTASPLREEQVQQDANLSQNGLIQIENEVKVCRRIRFATAVLMLATTCFAQEGFTVRSNGKQEWPAAEAQKIYHSACIIVQQEFGAHRIVRPQFTLVLGADKNQINIDQREVSLLSGIAIFSLRQP
jgi:hypothetical protein